MSLSSAARTTAATLARRSRTSRPVLSAVAASSPSTSASPSAQPHLSSASPSTTSQQVRCKTTRAAPDVLDLDLLTPDEQRRAKHEPPEALPAVARSDPTLYHTLLPAPTSALASLRARLGFDSTDKDIIPQLRVALTHPTWVELRDKILDDEKQNKQLGSALLESLQASRDSPGLQSHAQLAVLGNALGGILSSEHLHLQYPNLPTRTIKAALSSYMGPGTLADVAVELGMGAKGLAKWDPRAQQAPKHKSTRTTYHSKDVLADAMRACLGLIFQKKGLAALRHFIHSHFLSRMPLPPADYGPSTGSAAASSSHPLAPLLKFNNPKQSLSMTLQKHGHERPQSRLIAETGRLTQAPVFGVGVYSGRRKVGEGWGSAIRMAEYRAAEDALRRLYLRQSPPLSFEETPSAMLDEELRPRDQDVNEEYAEDDDDADDVVAPSSLGRDVWSVGEESSLSESANSSTRSAIRFKPRVLGESEIAFGNKG